MKYLFVCLALLFASSSWAQELKRFEAAKAKEQPILLVFSGSDWCAPCKRLHKEVLSQDAFLQLVDKEFSYLYLDFPVRKKNKKLQGEAIRAENEALSEKYNPFAQFPTVVLLSPQGDVLGEIKYHHEGPDFFIEALKKLLP
ncbi:thioredoxin family protein [Saprospira sp. CCB-QB6]|uniref:thioredoxin family protein n=1 Tax=Saprospira sp. CCB-QB6 TaxID=3023936 RepID=UPI00234BA8AA|nr:thioredoxin family protein [Saprospira sp. CCB-QB6]WCL79968.1 thioredoxin family protein [Saprospira sp. CCB-QB6]